MIPNCHCNICLVPIFRAKPNREDMSYSAEFGGELPSSLVEELREAGAEVVVYHLHRADVSTVITF